MVLRRRFVNAKRPLPHLLENSTKSRCQPSDSAIRGLFEFVGFAPFFGHFSDNLVTIDR